MKNQVVYIGHGNAEVMKHPGRLVIAIPRKGFGLRHVLLASVLCIIVTFYATRAYVQLQDEALFEMKIEKEGLWR